MQSKLLSRRVCYTPHRARRRNRLISLLRTLCPNKWQRCLLSSEEEFELPEEVEVPEEAPLQLDQIGLPDEEEVALAALAD